MPGGNFGTGYSGGYGGGAMKGPGYGQRAAGPYGGRMYLLMPDTVHLRHVIYSTLSNFFLSISGRCCLQCIGTVGWVAARASCHL